jgi:hypothetical protein
MRTLKSDERGMALLLAMLAIVVIGALVSGTFFAGRMEMVSGRNSVYAVQAAEAAEAGLAAAFSPWDRTWNSFPVGVDQPLAPVAIPGPTGVQYTTTVRRMQGGTYLIRSVGQKLDRSGNVMATRMLAKLGKLVPAGTATLDAAVTTKDAVTVSGNTVVDGHDTVPAGWDSNACGPLNDAAGIQTGSTVSTNGTSHVIDGEPPMVQNDTTVTDATFQGPFYSFLSSRTHTITNSNPPATTPTASGGVCNKSDIYNWGEPRRGGAAVVECEDYFPIVYFGAGTLKLQGGYGQGILLVAGDLWMSGGFEFVGLIIVLGEVKTTGTGAKVTGAVLSNNFYGEQTTLGGDPALRYSSCAIGAALEGTSSGYPLDQRPWAQLNPR